ncbi:hypothetical protein CPC16_008383 [Podila verticillata]|nr:hypothetical protein CPC16_008383 [Podila verticillata]
MFANKSALFAIAAAFMLLATVEAAPTAEAAVQAPAACVSCPQWPICTRRCQGGYWCDFNECTCTQTCRPGNIP